MKILSFIFIALLNYSSIAIGCDEGHWIQEKTSDGSIVILEDGSVWEISPIDRIYTAIWLPVTEIIACDDKLINVDDGEVAEAIRIK